MWGNAFGMLAVWVTMNFVWEWLTGTNNWSRAADRSYYEAGILLFFCWNNRKKWKHAEDSQ